MMSERIVEMRKNQINYLLEVSVENKLEAENCLILWIDETEEDQAKKRLR
jgi:hypothetical protein